MPRVAPATDVGLSKGHEVDGWQGRLERPCVTTVRPAATVRPVGRCHARGRESEGGWAFDGGRVPLVPVIDCRFVGAWRSLVAHQSGGLVVVGSNPAAPTNSHS